MSQRNPSEVGAGVAPLPMSLISGFWCCGEDARLAPQSQKPVATSTATGREAATGAARELDMRGWDSRAGCVAAGTVVKWIVQDGC